MKWRPFTNEGVVGLPATHARRCYQRDHLRTRPGTTGVRADPRHQRHQRDHQTHDQRRDHAHLDDHAAHQQQRVTLPLPVAAHCPIGLHGLEEVWGYPRRHRHQMPERRRGVQRRHPTRLVGHPAGADHTIGPGHAVHPSGPLATPRNGSARTTADAQMPRLTPIPALRSRPLHQPRSRTRLRHRSPLHLPQQIAQVLASDYHLGFEHDDAGWYLVDRVEDKKYRSPMDSGESSDYAYLGRLPRLDGRGGFLYIAGVHAVGAAGVVHYLDNHLTELYREVKTRRFSTIIHCAFDTVTRRIENSQRSSPLYKNEGTDAR